MNNTGNSHSNGFHCHRCDTGVLLRDGNDICCLQCGWRLSFAFGRPLKVYTTETIVAKLLYYDNKVLDDIRPRDWKLAGMAVKK